MSKELPSCSGCEHEYECVNMVCFYELLEREKKKIRADAIDECIAYLKNEHYKFGKVTFSQAIDVLEKLKEQK